MIQKRDIAICIILSLVTCGIYGLYWLSCLADDVNTVSDNPGDTSGNRGRTAEHRHLQHLPHLLDVPCGRQN